MNQLGEKIKEKRLAKGLTQSELAEGICTQTTVSNLEHETSIPSISTMLALAERLGINFNEIFDYIVQNSHSYYDLFNQVKALCSQMKHQEAYKLLTTMIEFDRLESNYEKKQFYYYLGITSLIGYQNFSEAHYNFNLALFLEVGKKLDIIDVLLTNGVGVAYFMNNDEEKAYTYFEKSLEQLDQLLSEPEAVTNKLELIKIYYNSAKFYSKIADYVRALELCTLGINLQHSENVLYGLEQLLYEKAYNLFKLNQVDKSKKYYFYAAALAQLNQNTHVLTIIKKNMTEFTMEGFHYW